MNLQTRPRKAPAGGAAGVVAGAGGDSVSRTGRTDGSPVDFGSRRAGLSVAGRKRIRSRRAASGTSITITRFAFPAQIRAKLASSWSTRPGSGPQLVETPMLSQLLRQPAPVSFRLPVHASRSPTRSSTIPVFSWKMAFSAIGVPPASQGTATFTSRNPRATIHASSSTVPQDEVAALLPGQPAHDVAVEVRAHGAGQTQRFVAGEHRRPKGIPSKHEEGGRRIENRAHHRGATDAVRL